MQDIRRGRPRSLDADRAIVDAALALIAEEGIGALSVGAVAERAGVAKTTIYRRWSCKEALLTDALATYSEPLADAQGETLRDRLMWLLKCVGGSDKGHPGSQLMPRLLSHRISDPGLYACYFAQVIAPRRDRFKAELRAAQLRGELRRDIDLDVAVNAFVAPVLYARYVAPQGGPVSEELIEQVVDLALAGLATPSATGAANADGSSPGR